MTAVEMAPLAGDPVIEGFSFVPQDSVLVDSFLRPKIAGHSFSSHITAFMHDVDVYSVPPDQLAAEHEHAPTTGRKVWYFFSPRARAKSARGGGAATTRRARTIGADGNRWWHSEGSQKEVKGSASGGYFKKFTYKEKTASGVVVKPGWLMVEYGITQEHGGANLVLCKIYCSPRTESPSVSGCHKRKAEENHLEAPPPTMQRLAVERLDCTASVRQGTHTPLFPPCGPAVEPEGEDIAALVFPGAVKYGEFSSGMQSPASAPPSSDELCFLDSSYIPQLRSSSELCFLDRIYIPGEDEYDEFSGGMLCPASEPPSNDELCFLVPSSMPESLTPAPAEIEPEKQPEKITFFDAGVSVDDLFELAAADQCNVGPPCPASAPPFEDEFLPASVGMADHTAPQTSSGGEAMSMAEYDALHGLAGYELLSTYVPISGGCGDGDAGTSLAFASTFDAFWYSSISF
ncbi:hypothetical protein ABZP36_018929 [Zizania latifolia]